MMDRTPNKRRAFTLVELLIGAMVSSVVFAAVLYGTVAFQRMFAASDQYLRASADQLRTSDYLVRDIRQSYTVTVDPTGKEMTLTIPDYIDPATQQPRLPTVKAGRPKFGVPTSIVNYGDPAAPVKVTYKLEGQSIIRQVGTQKSVISADQEDFVLGEMDQKSTVSATITFQPKFQRTKSTAAQTATLLQVRAAVRNTRRDQP